MPPSFDGNDGNDGNSGSVSQSGNAMNASAGWTFADRIDLPFVTVSTAVDGVQVPIAKARIPVTQFPAHGWTADWLSWVAVAQFAQDGWAARLDFTPVLPTDKEIQAELDALVVAARDERADALGEILDQSASFISYFLNLVAAKPTTCPATARLLTVASQVATFVVMYYKNLYNRPRPSTLCPALLPPIAVPGHPAFPSGHSTQAHLMALCLNAVIADKPCPPGGDNPMNEVLTALADRIAYNREIAGLHYPSDSAAGKELAGLMFKMLEQDGRNQIFQKAMSDAYAEWHAAPVFNGAANWQANSQAGVHE